MWMHGLWWALMVLAGLVWTGLVALARAVIGWDGWQQSGDWAARLPELQLPPWLVDMLGLQWVEWTRELLSQWGPQLQVWISGLPDVAYWAGLGLSLVWGFGLFLLLVVGGLGSLVIALLRRHAPKLRTAMA